MISKGLEKYLILKLNKKGDFNEKDFEQIEEISLNCKDLNSQNLDYDFKDFLKFENLKFLSLQNFNIKNYETNIINRIKSLCAVQMTNCKISSKSTLQGNLELIAFQHCKNLKIKYISNLKKLKILKIGNNKRISVKGISKLKALEKLYFKNIKLSYSRELELLPKLSYINLAESKYSKNLEKNLANNIEIDQSII